MVGNMVFVSGELITDDLVANLGSGCAIETSNLQVGTMELDIISTSAM